MTRPPRLAKTTYNHKLSGVYGEFGSGAGSRAFYLQAAMSPKELDRISLVSDIPGSEKWPVRALFQRDIDEPRVTKGLIPYLCNTDQVRFFNPLTLTLLPMDAHGHSVLPAMPTLKGGTMDIDGDKWITLERKNFYRLRWMSGAPQYAVLEWNGDRSELVAIDGQHRLFGLKRLWRDSTEVPPGEDFLRWRIPVVVVSFGGDEDGTSAPTVLDTVRSIFVSINTQAQPVNEARKILLSDDSINALCTQELIEAAHANDTLPMDERNTSMVPLVFFDWRGEERGGESFRSPAAVKTIVEIRNWFSYYFLGDDFTDEQKDAMEVIPTNPLHSAFQESRLTHEQGDGVRQWARQEFLPGLRHLLENFTLIRITSRRFVKWRRTFEVVPTWICGGMHSINFVSDRIGQRCRSRTKLAEELRRIKDGIEITKKQHLGHAP